MIVSNLAAGSIRICPHSLSTSNLNKMLKLFPSAEHFILTWCTVQCVRTYFHCALLTFGLILCCCCLQMEPWRLNQEYVGPKSTIANCGAEAKTEHSNSGSIVVSKSSRNIHDKIIYWKNPIFIYGSPILNKYFHQ